MQNNKITIEGKEYPVKFGYGASHRLGLFWGVKGILPLFQKALGVMGIGDDVKNTDVDALDEIQVAENILQFNNLELIGDIVQHGIAKGLGVAVEELPFDREELMEALLEDAVAIPPLKGD